MKRIGLISDTHGYMDERILHHLEGCDEVWHAGDIGKPQVAEAIEKQYVLRAVYGNIDGGNVRQLYPEHQHFEIEGLKIWITHIAGTPGHYYPHIREGLMTYKPDLFVCGHSHICLVKRDSQFGHVHMNPGAAGKHGFHKVRTLLRFILAQGKIEQLEVVELGTRAAVT